MENIIQIVITKYHPISTYTIINTPVVIDKVSDVQYNDIEKYHTNRNYKISSMSTYTIVSTPIVIDKDIQCAM